MIALELLSTIILLFAFFYGAIKLWRKDKPLYFQIIICAIGCFALFHLSVIVMAYCNVNETYFNDSFFGILGCYMLLLCANSGAIDKAICENPKRDTIILSIFSGLVELALTVIVGYLYYGFNNIVFYIYILIQIPACIVVYYNAKHLLSPIDDVRLLEGMRLTDIFSIIFIVVFTFDILSWKTVGIVSAICDLLVSILILLLSFFSVKGAKKWSI